MCLWEVILNNVPDGPSYNDLNPDKQHNKFIHSFQTSDGEALVYEPLDISLYDYMKKRNDDPMPLSDIRTIIQQAWTQHHQMESKVLGFGTFSLTLYFQMATAFDELKENQVDNIMMMNHQRPLEVKLIDFSVAIATSRATWFSFTSSFNVRLTICITKLEWVSSLLVLSWRSSCVPPPCHMFCPSEEWDSRQNATWTFFVNVYESNLRVNA